MDKLIFFWRMFGIRRRELLIGDEINGYDVSHDDYALGYMPPRYPMPAIMGDSYADRYISTVQS